MSLSSRPILPQGRNNPWQKQPKAEATMPLVCRIKGLEEQSCMFECWE